MSPTTIPPATVLQLGLTELILIVSTFVGLMVGTVYFIMRMQSNHRVQLRAEIDLHNSTMSREIERLSREVSQIDQEQSHNNVCREQNEKELDQKIDRTRDQMIRFRSDEEFQSSILVRNSEAMLETSRAVQKLVEVVLHERDLQREITKRNLESALKP